MQLVQHGGMCCGIRHIHELGDYPDDVLHEEDANPEARGFEVSLDNRSGLYPKAAPEESAEDRLKRLIYYCERFRPQGIIEVVTANEWDESDEGWEWWDDHDEPPKNPTNVDNAQTCHWRETLTGLGFNPVNVCVNSNTCNHITVWHRNSGEVPKLPNPDPEVEVAEPTPDPFAPGLFHGIAIEFNIQGDSE